jgi:tyrosine-protein phosphatase non-receptor type 4
VKISFKRKQFFIQLRKELTESYDTLLGKFTRKCSQNISLPLLFLGFNLSSYRSCKNLWKYAVEHHSFFRLQSPKMPGRKFPLWGLSSKFRYSGRTEFQTVSESALASNQAKSRWEKAFFRSPSRRVLRQTMPNLDRTRNLLASPEHSSIGNGYSSEYEA